MNAIERALYRGQDIETGEWRFGYYWYRETTETHLITLPNSAADYEVNPETVGQWTGLTDTAGNKVFEGDILNLEKFTDKYVVCWDSMYAYYYLRGVHALLVKNMGECVTGWIIGSIHSNPELLKGGE